eukprot:gb/GECH01001540.1/.p1 GENE.gb/GECH01001540.1/~~gb/GECH01001540.1/.p1  ORF type:complete len:486 (+),score=110.01 gb/GECH01001540.1/:1-1458(+)
MWSGAVTHNSVKINVKTIRDLSLIQIVVQETERNNTQTRDTHTAIKSDQVLSVVIDGLKPWTQYNYHLENKQGEILSLIKNTNSFFNHKNYGSFHTFPEPEHDEDFTFAFASCARTGSNSRVFDTIGEQNPLFFIHMGDFHYENIAEDNITRFEEAYEKVLASPRQRAFYQKHPLVYTWDDHDYGPNNAVGTSPSKPAAEKAYRHYVPHYPLPHHIDGVHGQGPIYHSFSVGRIRFIVLDTRSRRYPELPTFLGEDQKHWLKEELRRANQDHDDAAFVVVVSSVPWLSEGRDDDWSGYPEDRQDVANFIVEQNLHHRLVMISGDAHMLAIDPGMNNVYASRRPPHASPSAPSPGFPVMQAAALDRHGSVKGGPFCLGPHPGRGQFGVMHVRHVEDGGACVHLKGMNKQGDVLMELETCSSNNGDNDNDSSNGDRDGEDDVVCTPSSSLSSSSSWWRSGVMVSVFAVASVATLVMVILYQMQRVSP